MNNTQKTALTIIVIALVVIALSGLWLAAPTLRGIVNRHDYAVQKVDDATSYETIKEVEDTCRAMIASYQTDRDTYEMYKNSDNTEKQSWAEQAKMRANKTANTYNTYILKNSFVWRDNVPADIYRELAAIQ